jgi:hypothetical protein
MVPQAFHYPNEHAHFWADIPALAVIAAVCWIWHPNRAARGFDDASRTRPG